MKKQITFILPLIVASLIMLLLAAI